MPGRPAASVEERFLEKINFEPETGCWLWTSWLSNRGYGMFSVNGFSETAHKFSFQRFYHYIPEGLVIHHICKVKRCVNPTHMVLMTSRQNLELYYDEMGFSY